MGRPHSTAYVRFDEERCTGCAACLRVCPTKAIRIRAAEVDPLRRPVHRLRRLHPHLPGRRRERRRAPAGGHRRRSRRHRPGVARALRPVPGRHARRCPAGAAPAGVSPHVDMSFFLEMFQYAAEEFIRATAPPRSLPGRSSRRSARWWCGSSLSSSRACCPTSCRCSGRWP